MMLALFDTVFVLCVTVAYSLPTLFQPYKVKHAKLHINVTVRNDNIVHAVTNNLAVKVTYIFKGFCKGIFVNPFLDLDKGSSPHCKEPIPKI
jgi:hypothetical protein